MSKLLLLFLLILLPVSSNAQEENFAVITEPQIGTQEAAQNLIEVVNHINAGKNISCVVVLGNITANGKFDEFIWAQEILDGLTIPYFVIGGEKDYLLSDGNGSEIQLLWGKNQIIYHNNNLNLLFINSILPEFREKKYINIESITLIDEQISRNNNDRIITFSFYPIAMAENSKEFYQPLLNKKIFSIVSRDEKSENKSLYEGLYLNRKDGWGYLLVSQKKDSLFFKKILSEEIKKKSKPEIAKGVFAKPSIIESKKSAKNLSSENLLWSVSMEKSTQIGSIADDDKIFTVFKSGTVVCLNDKGSEKWQYETNKRIVALPKIENDLLILSTEDGDIFTLNANTGNPYQTIGIGEKITSGVSVVEIDESGDKTKAIVVGTQYGNLYCYDLLTLDPVWTQQLSDGGENIWVSSQIGFSNNKIFFLDNQGTLDCISAKNGMLIWRIPSSKGGWRTSVSQINSNNLVTRGSLLYLVDDGGRLFCIDALLGTPKWELKNVKANGQIISNGQNEFILPTKKNTIAFVSLKTEKIIKEIEFPIENNDESISDLVLIGEKIIAGYSDGWLYIISAKQRVEKYFRKGQAPIVSLHNLTGNCLVTDYDGNITLLNLSNNK